jgi:hypothetical protein
MDLSHNNSSKPANPESCLELGKECRDCVSQSAALVAVLCPTLDPVAAQSIFFKMYPSPGCINMSRVFVRVYLGETEAETPKPMPMGVASTPFSRPMTATA